MRHLLTSLTHTRMELLSTRVCGVHCCCPSPRRLLPLSTCCEVSRCSLKCPSLCFVRCQPPLPWPSPMCCIPPVKPGSTFLYWLKYGTLQYTIISPIISIIAMVLNFFGLYGDGEFAADHGYVYISFVQNCTQLISLYCLVWLYVAMKNELAPFSPMAKFLVVKSVVFFTFWYTAAALTPTPLTHTDSLPSSTLRLLTCVAVLCAMAGNQWGWLCW